MDSDKIQPVLLEELTRLRAEGRRDQLVDVIVSVAGTRDGRLRDAAALEADARASQAPLRARLDAMGVRGYTPLTLANAVEVKLTPDQVLEIATEPSVVAVVWNRLERVTTA